MKKDIVIQQLLEQARSYVDERKFLHAIQLYTRIVTLAPALETAWVELAHVYAESNQRSVAENLLKKMLKKTLEPFKVKFFLANLYFKNGENTKALALYKQILLQEKELSKPIRAHVHFSVALCYFYARSYKLAENHFRKTKKIDPYFPRINESLGELLLQRGIITEAITLLQEAISHDPYSTIGHHLLGVAYLKQQDLLAAHDAFLQAIEVDPNDPNAWQMCGEVLISLERFDEAEKYLRKSLEINPKLSNAIATVGFLYMKRGDPDSADQCFERALDLDPENEKAMRGKQQLKHSRKVQ